MSSDQSVGPQCAPGQACAARLHEEADGRLPADALVCGFEIVECIRKLAIVGAPVFFDPAGSPAQLIFGLLITFLTASIYAYQQPYTAKEHSV